VTNIKKWKDKIRNSKQRNAATKRRKRELIYPITSFFKKRILKTINLMFKVSFNYEERKGYTEKEHTTMDSKINRI